MVAPRKSAYTYRKEHGARVTRGQVLGRGRRVQTLWPGSSRRPPRKEGGATLGWKEGGGAGSTQAKARPAPDIGIGFQAGLELNASVHRCYHTGMQS